MMSHHDPLSRTPRELVIDMFRCQRILDNPLSQALFFDEQYSWTVDRVQSFCREQFMQLQWLVRTGSDGCVGEMAQ